jgi:cyclophilin family peptidyl-prolyl cis-trans isomerase/predicted small secreted protein
MLMRNEMKTKTAASVLLLTALVLSACTMGKSPATPSGQGQDPASLGGEQAGESAVSKPSELSWDEPPEMQIDPQAIYQATFKTEKGDVVVELFAERAPVTVNNFVFLARAGYYDDTTFHRVIPGFMAQGGDPAGTGTGGPGYQFQDEILADLTFNEPGLLAMANAGPDTNGSQFFITYVPTPHLNSKHTIFGKVLEGMAVLNSLSARDPAGNPDIKGDRLLTVEIEEVSESMLPTPTATREPSSPTLEDGRPLAFLAVESRENLYTHPPDMIIDSEADYEATITTNKGTIRLDLSPLDAPQSVNNFYVLASLGYWDDFPIAYIEEDGFLITGAPSGSPDSHIGYSVLPEIGLENTKGAVGYVGAAEEVASNGSQLYFLLGDQPDMDGIMTVFGYISEGMDILEQLTIEDRIIQINVELTE